MTSEIRSGSAVFSGCGSSGGGGRAASAAAAADAFPFRLTLRFPSWKILEQHKDTVVRLCSGMLFQVKP